jgi:hypothetical protein
LREDPACKEALSEGLPEIGRLAVSKKEAGRVRSKARQLYFRFTGRKAR